MMFFVAKSSQRWLAFSFFRIGAEREEFASVSKDGSLLSVILFLVKAWLFDIIKSEDNNG